MTLTELLPEIEKTAQIIGLVLSIIAITILITWCVLVIIGLYKENDMKKEYIKTLNDHEKAIIKDYETIKWHPFKKGNRK